MTPLVPQFFAKRVITTCYIAPFFYHDDPLLGSRRKNLWFNWYPSAFNYPPSSNLRRGKKRREIHWGATNAMGSKNDGAEGGDGVQVMDSKILALLDLLRSETMGEGGNWVDGHNGDVIFFPSPLFLSGVMKHNSPDFVDDRLFNLPESLSALTPVRGGGGRDDVSRGSQRLMRLTNKRKDKIWYRI